MRKQLKCEDCRFVYIGLSEHTKAMQWLEYAYDARDAFWPTSKVFPPYKPLRGSHQFRSLLSRVSLAGGRERPTA
jgi:hypothetical protein